MSYSVYLPNYSIGENCYKELPYVARNYGKKAVVIGGKTAMEKSKDALLEGIIIKYLNFIADIFCVPADARIERIRKYADIFGLTDDLAQPISAYSHGMKQKLAIISAWLHTPKLIIMDEPFVGLDPKAAHELKLMMREHCDAGGAIFFSTHVLEVAEKLCDKVAIIKSGRLIASGSMEEVKGDSSLEDVFLELEGDGNA